MNLNQQKSDTIKPSIVNFPSEIDVNNNVCVYDSNSEENWMAVLSHFLHNQKNKLHLYEREMLMTSILDFLESKPEMTKNDQYLENLLN